MTQKKSRYRIVTVGFVLLVAVWGVYAIPAAIKASRIRSKCDRINWCTWLVKSEFDASLQAISECEYVCLFDPYAAPPSFQKAGISDESVAKELAWNANAVEAPHLALLDRDFQVIYHKAFQCPGRGAPPAEVQLIRRPARLPE